MRIVINDLWKYPSYNLPWLLPNSEQEAKWWAIKDIVCNEASIEYQMEKYLKYLSRVLSLVGFGWKSQ